MKTKAAVTAVKRRTTDSASAACLVVIYGVDLGRKFPLDREQFIIGRAEETDIQFDQESVSRSHARIVVRGENYVITDLGSTNGTYVNDRVIDDRTLHDGDIVQIGQTIVKFLTGGNIEASYHEEIYRLTTTDALTQTYNKRFLIETLDREVSRARRYSRDVSLAMIDLDNFKRINDTYGHLAGDAVLRQVAAEIKGKIRRDDIFARYGGEEFAIVLPEQNLVRAATFGEKIRKLIERTSLTIDNKRVPVTISIGLAAREGEDDVDALIKRADDKLYAAKHAGRNCIRS